MSEAAREIRIAFERAYGALPHEVRRAFDRECAARALAHHPDPRAVALLALASDDPALPAQRDALYRALEAMRDVEAHPARIALAAGRAAYAATDSLHPGLANSDYVPTSANEAINAVYLATYVATADVDAAEAAVLDELRWARDRCQALRAKMPG